MPRKPIFPIYIPSKGRSDIVRGTTDMLDEAGLSYNIVVAPREAKAYRERYRDKVLVLPRNDRGLAYSRGWIHSLARKLGHEYFWQMDDDLRGLLYRTPAGVRTIPPDKALYAMEQETLRFKNIGVSGTNHNSWPPSNQASKFNRLPVQCVLVHSSVKSRYRDCGTREDMDFVLQILEEGWCTIMFDWLRTDAPRLGSNTGGMNLVYKDLAWQRAALEQMVEWHPVLSLVEDKNGLQLKNNRIWSTFTQKPIKV